MQDYVRQKASQALEELAKDAPLVDRLIAARTHLSIVNTEHYMKDAPGDVKHYMRKFFDADIATDIDAASKACVGVIETSLTADE